LSYLFLLLFLAAVVGIFRPYVTGLKRSHFAIAAVVSFALVGVFAPNTASTDKKSGAPAVTEADTPRGPIRNEVSGAETLPTSQWEYSDTHDAMRGTTAKFASVQSDNTVDLDFPYDEVHGQIWIRRRAEDGLNVAFEVTKGQVLCHSFSDGYVSMKFDNGPIQKFRCTGSSDGSSETAFIEDEGRALAALKRAKRTIVEAEFYQQGRQQFVFQTAGLNWK
jgi:hypothetical protein